MPARSASNSKRVKFIKRSTDVLVIAPHGVNVPGIRRNDIPPPSSIITPAKVCACGTRDSVITEDARKCHKTPKSVK